MQQPHLILPEEGKGTPLAQKAATLDTVMKTSILTMQAAADKTGLVISTSRTLTEKWDRLVKS